MLVKVSVINQFGTFESQPLEYSLEQLLQFREGFEHLESQSFLAVHQANVSFYFPPGIIKQSVIKLEKLQEEPNGNAINSTP